MARLITLLEQQLDRMPPTVVTQATTWWDTALALVKLQEIGLGVCLPVKVCYYTLCACGPFVSILRILLRPFLDHDASRLLDDRLPYVLFITWPQVPYAKYCASIWHMRMRGHVITNLLHDNALRYYGSYNIYYSAWANYVDGSVPGIAFLNFESTIVVRCRWFWLEKDEFEHA